MNWGAWFEEVISGPKLIVKARKRKAPEGQMGFDFGGSKPKPQAKPQPKSDGGWQPIPGGKHGGQRRRKGTGWEYRYPDGKGGYSSSPPEKKRSKILVVKKVKDPKTGKVSEVEVGKPEAKPEERSGLKWDKVGDEYRMDLGDGRQARLFKDGKAWFVKLDGKLHLLPKKAEFGHAEGIIKEALAKPKSAPKSAPKPTLTVPKEPKPKAESKRKFEDVGEKIGGARKDIAALARMDKDELEKDPAAAYKMVTRDNVLGKWGPEHLEADRAAGLSPEVSALKRGIMKSVATRPPDTAEDRDLYRQGCMMLQKGLGRVESAKDVKDLLSEWYDGVRGRVSGQTVDRDSELGKKMHLAFVEVRAGKTAGTYAAQIELESQGIVGVRVLPNGKLQALEEGSIDQKREAVRMMLSMGRKFAQMCNVDVRKRGGRVGLSPVPEGYLRVYKMEHGTKHRQRVFSDAAGTKSYEALLLETGKGKSRGPRGATGVKRDEQEGGVRVWQRKLGTVERRGLPKIPGGADGNAIMNDLGVRAVEYGNWAAEDERQWHTEMSHAGLHDLAGVLGIPAGDIALKGRLALAFGARGKGGKRAGAAHYEPSRKVINLTKMHGNGTLAHEWAHFLDHAIVMAAAPEKGKAEFLSDQKKPQTMVSKPVRDAMRQVMDAIKFTKRAPEQLEKLRKEKQAARTWLDENRSKINRMASGADKNKAIDAYNAKVKAYNAIQTTERADSEHYAAAQERGAYWAKDIELFARSFESYVEDKLQGQDQRSSYLVDGTIDLDPQNYQGAYLWPDDPKRAEINKAMDALMDVLRGEDQFKKALAAFA